MGNVPAMITRVEQERKESPRRPDPAEVWPPQRMMSGMPASGATKASHITRCFASVLLLRGPHVNAEYVTRRSCSRGCPCTLRPPRLLTARPFKLKFGDVGDREIGFGCEAS